MPDGNGWDPVSGNTFKNVSVYRIEGEGISAFGRRFPNAPWPDGFRQAMRTSEIAAKALKRIEARRWALEHRRAIRKTIEFGTVYGKPNTREIIAAPGGGFFLA